MNTCWRQRSIQLVDTIVQRTSTIMKHRRDSMRAMITGKKIARNSLVASLRKFMATSPMTTTMSMLPALVKVSMGCSVSHHSRNQTAMQELGNLRLNLHSVAEGTAQTTATL